MAAFRFRFLDHNVPLSDSGRPFSYPQIAEMLDTSVKRVKTAELRVVRKAIDVIFAYDLPQVPKLPF